MFQVSTGVAWIDRERHLGGDGAVIGRVRRREGHAQRLAAAMQNRPGRRRVDEGPGHRCPGDGIGSAGVQLRAAQGRAVSDGGGRSSSSAGVCGNTSKTVPSPDAAIRGGAIELPLLSMISPQFGPAPLSCG